MTIFGGRALKEVTPRCRTSSAQAREGKFPVFKAQSVVLRADSSYTPFSRGGSGSPDWWVARLFQAAWKREAGPSTARPNPVTLVPQNKTEGLADDGGLRPTVPSSERSVGNTPDHTEAKGPTGLLGGNPCSPKPELLRRDSSTSVPMMGEWKADQSGPTAMPMSIQAG